ncbi:putative crotonobetaine/carnitine-CoA ligase [Pseudonocardia sulfidoxydans NBRC 16205]|uniref:Putative crotonobetaine/carnitine-CoA ligase n=1 Tax=Pseudonocardia sulfidoxydans NBRC 16205 TaxID=1223511 RepID=A0A511DAF9_9PSEU|nr:AMP-binding protein [Pseudonocardia sulfidoxydans]GEL21789.1 putative crotonobetaine/carnitine-CoA ligase [Pseudonocardia sulfidoxydans NBRC 16205]
MERLTDWTTLARRWEQAVAAVPDASFLEFVPSEGEGSAWTYAEFDAVVDETGRALGAYGVRPGDTVQLVLPNHPAFVATLLAAARGGWTVVPCDPRSTPAELARQAARTGAVVAVCGAAQAAAYRASGTVLPLVPVAPQDAGVPAAPGPAGPGHAPADPTFPLSLMFTSGTTSAPKMVEVTQANYAFAGDVMAAAAGLRPGSRFLVVLPLFHANAQYYSVSASISVGATVVLAERFSASRFLTQAERVRATHASLFAAPIRMILARAEPVALTRPMENVWFSQNLTADEYGRFAALVGCRPRQIYGMTETAPAVLMSRRLNLAPTTIGSATPGCHVRLRDPDADAPPAPGGTGRIQVGGFPGLSLFRAYRDDPIATASTFTEVGPDGFTWMDTGDLGRLTDDGEVEFIGRGGDLLKVAGENVSVVAIEAALVEHPDVLDAAVVGMPDPVRDEVAVAFVVPTADAPSTLAHDLGLWCAEHLSGPRLPREIHVVEELPRTAVGKIQRFRLVERSTG